MLSRRLTTTLAACGVVVLASCGGGAIEDAVVRPGITAIGEARSETCAANASVLRSAIDAYTMLEGEPPVDEAALVPDYIREETTDWDVVDGEVVAQNPACGVVPDVTPIDDIVTSSPSVPTAEETFARWTDDMIAAVGGEACARELTAIFAAAEAYVVVEGAEPDDFADLVAAGHLDKTPTLWVTDGPELAPADGSPCTDLRE